ncbi:MAG: DNA methyltransferase [Pyrinomonadaceae bacterium MAG19_C2-C3]|nr:DNA methyltransferase [Pyrinomonadaceae bacterium MAG19_C2-C3]
MENERTNNVRTFPVAQESIPLALNAGVVANIPTTVVGTAQIECANALTLYEQWDAPTVIISDGAYGLSLFPGDPATSDELAEWYAPHIAAWSRYALPETSLWFWGTEVGWASVHPVLKLHGWEYRALHVWDKGIGHIAGNVNSKTIRGFPVVTEVCAQYVRDVRMTNAEGQAVPMKQWLREEWQRAGLPLSKTNDACGVKNAATRKYFTQCHLWYFPPTEMMERLVAYANEHGRADGRPYFSLDGVQPVTGAQWTRMRSKWNHMHGITNVWSEPAVRGAERLKDEQAKAAHANQKSLRLIERIITASSDAGDVVWEPFGGLCPAAVASLRTGRRCFSAESIETFYNRASVRLAKEETLFAETASR